MKVIDRSHASDAHQILTDMVSAHTIWSGLHENSIAILEDIERGEDHDDGENIGTDRIDELVLWEEVDDDGSNDDAN